MVVVPMARPVSEAVATPPTTGDVANGVGAAPMKKPTVPSPSEGVSVAVRATGWPNVDGFGAEAMLRIEDRPPECSTTLRLSIAHDSSVPPCHPGPLAYQLISSVDDVSAMP